MIFSILYFVSPTGGTMPLYEFFSDLQSDPELLAAMVASISKMRNSDNWGGKLSKKIRGDIFEIRAIGGQGIARVFYFTLPGQKLMLLNGYKKKRDTVDPRQLARAEILESAYKQGKAKYEVFTQD